MKVSIKFHGMQRHVTNTDSIDMPITETTRLSDALEYVKQHYPGLHLEEGTIIAAVNLEVASLDRILKDKDSVSFLPNIAGG
jgi:molybdopterin converting factor small subunit